MTTGTPNTEIVLLKLRRAIKPGLHFLPWSNAKKVLRSYQECEAALAAEYGAHKSAETGVWLAISEWSTWKDVLLSKMTEADWQETMDGLRAALPPGYTEHPKTGGG